jgi:hypothetical protein
VDTFEVHIHQLRANEIDLMVTGHGSGPRKKSEKIAVPFGIVEEIWDTDAQIGLLLRLSLVLFHDPLMQAIFSPLPG